MEHETMKGACHEEDPLLDSDTYPRGHSQSVSLISSSTGSFLSQLISDTRHRLTDLAVGASYNSTTSSSSSQRLRRGTPRRRGERRRQHILRAQTALALMYVTIVFYSLLITIGPLYFWWRPKRAWCSYAEDDEEENGHGGVGESTATDQTSEYENPDYLTDPCRRFVRLPALCGLTLEECDFSRRMLASVLLGGMIGYERRSADRPAGIRTMGLVSLGACFFTISSIQAFKSSPMGWDASRVTAALPSGVGFLGGALIWKGTIFVDAGEEKHQVHGLTTAASLWLSAAVGVGAGGALYAVTLYATVLVVLVLRFGPKMYNLKDTDDMNDGDDDDDEDEGEEDEDDNHDRGKENERTETEGRNDGLEAAVMQPNEESPTKVPIARRRKSRSSHNIPTFGS